MKSALDARRVAQNAIGLAVREARAAEWSWDRISVALGGSPNGETLRATGPSDIDLGARRTMASSIGRRNTVLM